MDRTRPRASLVGPEGLHVHGRRARRARRRHVPRVHERPDWGFPALYSSWAYTLVDAPHRLEFIHNIADEHGATIDPATIGAAGIPRDVRYVITFESIGDDATRLTVTELGYLDPEQPRSRRRASRSPSRSSSRSTCEPSRPGRPRIPEAARTRCLAPRLAPPPVVRFRHGLRLRGDRRMDAAAAVIRRQGSRAIAPPRGRVRAVDRRRAHRCTHAPRDGRRVRPAIRLWDVR